MHPYSYALHTFSWAHGHLKRLIFEARKPRQQFRPFSLTRCMASDVSLNFSQPQNFILRKKVLNSMCPKTPSAVLFCVIDVRVASWNRSFLLFSPRNLWFSTTNTPFWSIHWELTYFIFVRKLLSDLIAFFLLNNLWYLIYTLVNYAPF